MLFSLVVWTLGDYVGKKKGLRVKGRGVEKGNKAKINILYRYASNGQKQRETLYQ